MTRSRKRLSFAAGNHEVPLDLDSAIARCGDAVAIGGPATGTYVSFGIEPRVARLQITSAGIRALLVTARPLLDHGSRRMKSNVGRRIWRLALCVMAMTASLPGSRHRERG